PITLFGQHYDGGADGRGYPTVPQGGIGKSCHANWAEIESSKGNYNWTGLDGRVADALAHGVDYFYSSDMIPGWAISDHSDCRASFCGSGNLLCAGSPDNIQDWRDFLTALVTRYKGKIKFYEAWNEPYNYMSASALVPLAQAVNSIVHS